MNRDSETSGPVKSPTVDQRQHLRQAKETLHFALASLCTLLDAYAFLLRRLTPPEDDQGSRGISQGDDASTTVHALKEALRRQN